MENLTTMKRGETIFIELKLSVKEYRKTTPFKYCHSSFEDILGFSSKYFSVTLGDFRYM